jgi:mannitol/fructose-specific phosphotransferase system IIA component (Ntr-type)
LLEIIHALLSLCSCPHWQRFNLIYAAHTHTESHVKSNQVLLLRLHQPKTWKIIY